MLKLVKPQNKVRTTVTLSPGQFDRLGEVAEHLGMSKSALVGALVDRASDELDKGTDIAKR